MKNTLPKSQSVVPAPPRRSTRVGRGNNPHLHFDPSPSQHQLKIARIISRARERHVLSEATWADIMARPLVVTPPPLTGSTVRHPPSSSCSGSPCRALIVAGSRRSPPPRRHIPRPALGAFSTLFRHMCFLSVMRGLSSPLSASFYPGAIPLEVVSTTPLMCFSAVDAPVPFTPDDISFAPKDNREMKYRQGVQSLPPDEVRAALDKEFTKLFDTHQALRPIAPDQISPTAVRIHSSVLLKAKYFGDGSYDRVSARLAAGGNTQPEGSYGETYAPTADEASTLCAFASFAAHAVLYGYVHNLNYSNFDVKGAFLRV